MDPDPSMSLAVQILLLAILILINAFFLRQKWLSFTYNDTIQKSLKVIISMFIIGYKKIIHVIG